MSSIRDTPETLIWTSLVVFCWCYSVVDDCLAQGAGKAKPVGKWVEPKTLQPDWKESEQVTPGNPERLEKYVPDAFPEPDSAGAGPQRIGLPAVAGGEISTALIVNPKCQRALISYWKPSSNGAGTTRLVMCDLAAGEVLEAYTIPTAAVPLDLSDDGAHIAVRFLPEAGANQQNHVEVWGWSEKGIVREVRFLPHDNSIAVNEQIAAAAFLDDERLVLLTSYGQMILLEWRKARWILVFPEYIPTGGLGLSFNRKNLFAVTIRGFLAVLDTSNFLLADYHYMDSSRNGFRLHPSGAQFLGGRSDVRVVPGQATVGKIPIREGKTISFELTQRGLGHVLALLNNDFALFESIELPSFEPGKDIDVAAEANLRSQGKQAAGVHRRATGGQD